MSGQATRAAFAHVGGLQPSERFVLVAIGDSVSAEYDWTLLTGPAVLVDKTGLSRHGVRLALAELERRRLISRFRTAGRRTTAIRLEIVAPSAPVSGAQGASECSSDENAPLTVNSKELRRRSDAPPEYPAVAWELANTRAKDPSAPGQSRKVLARVIAGVVESGHFTEGQVRAAVVSDDLHGCRVTDGTLRLACQRQRRSDTAARQRAENAAGTTRTDGPWKPSAREQARIDEDWARERASR